MCVCEYVQVNTQCLQLPCSKFTYTDKRQHLRLLPVEQPQVIKAHKQVKKRQTDRQTDRQTHLPSLCSTTSEGGRGITWRASAT